MLSAFENWPAPARARHFAITAPAAAGLKTPASDSARGDATSSIHSRASSLANDKRVGRAVGLLLALENRLEHQPARRALQHVLLVEHAQLVFGRKRFRQRGDLPVEERESSFDRVRHQHPIALRREQIARQERVDFQVLILRQRAPRRELGREAGEQRVDGIRRSSTLACASAENSRFKRRGAPPARLVPEAGPCARAPGPARRTAA